MEAFDSEFWTMACAVCVNTAISSLEELCLGQNITMRLRNVCSGERKKVSVLEGQRGTNFRPCSSDNTDKLLNCSSAVSVVCSQKRNSTLLTVGLRNEMGIVRCSFVKEC